MAGSNGSGGDTRINEGAPLPGADPVATMTSLTASRDVGRVQEMIRQRYGFVAPAEYCFDLIRFIEALTDGQ